MLRSPTRKGRSGLRGAGKSALFPHGIQSSSAPVQKLKKKEENLFLQKAETDFPADVTLFPRLTL